MARIEYIDETACHVTLTRDDVIALVSAGEIVEPRAKHASLTRSGRLSERHVPGTRALVVVLDRGLEGPACP